MQWIVVKTFSFPYEAQIAKTQLEAFGIPAYIENEHTINMDWFYSNAFRWSSFISSRKLC